MPIPRLIKLKVRAGSKESSLLRRADDSFEVRVRARAERGLANQEAIALLAAALGVPAKRLRIVKGSTSPSKIVALLGA